MKMMKIITTDNPEEEKLLRTPSKRLTKEEITSKEIQTFIEDLIHTAENAKLQAGWESAGIAAVQVGRPIQLFIGKDLIHNIFKIYINPEIEYLGSSKDIHIEGCLSIPTTTGKVERFKRIRIRYTDRRGNPQVEKVDGYNARILQHEVDHLNGVLFTDKLV